MGTCTQSGERAQQRRAEHTSGRGHGEPGLMIPTCLLLNTDRMSSLVEVNCCLDFICFCTVKLDLRSRIEKKEYIFTVEKNVTMGYSFTMTKLYLPAQHFCIVLWPTRGKQCVGLKEPDAVSAPSFLLIYH